MKERLRRFLDDQGMNARQFAERLGVQASSVSHVLTGRNKPGVDFLEKLLRAFPEADVHWLITGEVKSAAGNVPETIPTKEKKTEVDEDDGKVSHSDEKRDEVLLLRPDGTYLRFKQV